MKRLILFGALCLPALLAGCIHNDLPYPVVTINIEAIDRLNLLRDVTVVLSDMGANVLSCNTISHRDGMVEMRFLFQVSDISLIDAVQRKLLGLEGVFDAHRMLPGQGGKKK